MNTYIVKAHRAGIFSNINKVITCMSLYENIQVDWRAGDGCVYGTPEDGNIWEKLFYQLPYPLNNLRGRAFLDEGIVYVTDYPHQVLTYKNAGLLYQAEALIGWRKTCNQFWNDILPLPGIIEAAEKFIYEFSFYRPYTAVLVRGNPSGGEQITNRPQTFEDYARALDKICAENCAEKIFLMAGDTESIEWFRGRFDVMIHPATRRSSSRDIELHFTGGQTVQDAKQCLIEVLIASRAVTLVHGVSNMATAALYMNPKLKSVYLP